MLRFAYLVLAVLALGFMTGLAQEGEGGPPPVLMLEGDAERGATLAAQVCSACHGEDGNSQTPAFPRLSGQVQEFLAIQTWLFKAGIRMSPIMGPVAATLSDQDIADVAAYLASATPAGEPWPVANPDLLGRGAELFHMGNVEAGLIACAVCHGSAGEGVAATGVPRISGQSPAYLESILHEFGMVPDFGAPLPNAMHIVVSALSEEDLEAVIAFVASQPWGEQ